MKTKTIRAAIVAALTIAASAILSAFAGQNLIVNGAFEIDQLGIGNWYWQHFHIGNIRM